MKRISLLFILLISLASCKEIASSALKNIVENKSKDTITEDNFKTVAVDSLFQLSIPKHMREMNTLNDEATLQYANIYKEIYTIVLIEDEQDFVTTFQDYGDYDDNKSVIENYKIAQERLFSEAMFIKNIHEYGLMEINGNSAKQISFNSNIEGIEAYYLVTFINANNNIYMNMTWTLYDRKQKYSNIMETINSSFEAIETKKISDEI